MPVAHPVAVNLGRLVFWTVLASTPLALAFFTSRRWGIGKGAPWPWLPSWANPVQVFVANLRRLLVTYRWHLGLFVLILAEKNWVDSLNDPIRGVFGDKTWLIAKIEGGATYWIQRTFESDALTAFLSVHYLWMYVFLNYFTVILFAYRDDRQLANLAALNYSIIYILAIPFYIFFNVQVTNDYIPGMKALLYHSGPSFYDFFVRVDPLDNAFPSLHIAIPFGLILVTWWTMRRRGYTLGDWEFRGYLMFLIANTAVFAFSILYLGIHWITDIPGGMLIGLLGAIIAEEFEKGFFAGCHGLEARVRSALLSVWRRLRPRTA